MEYIFGDVADCHYKSVPPGITQTFNDGTPVLKGFVLSNKPVAEDRHFPLPEVPPGWQPDPYRVWNQGKDKENQPSAKPPPQAALSHAEWKANQLSADQVSVYRTVVILF